MTDPKSFPVATRLLFLFWACFRLGRFHTFMGYVVFTAPAILTAVLYSGAHPSSNSLSQTLGLMARLFICVVLYRGAGLAWDDIVDREVDARVTRTKTRPIPSGDISVPGAVMFCIAQSALTVMVFCAMLPVEAGYVNMIGTAIFLVYPFLKFYTHWAQLGGAVLIAAISPMAWAACAAWSSSYTGSGIGAAFKSMRANWQLCLTSFVIEMIFSFLHETVYGCQDTPEDLELGVFSTSILFGYEGSKRLVMPLTILYLCALAFAFRTAGLHWVALMFIPSCVLITEAHKVKMDSPVSCGVYARRALYAKAAVCATAALDLMLIQASVVM